MDFKIDRTVTHDADKVARLIVLVLWYAATPNEDFGDSFGEHVTDVIAELMPALPELKIPYPTHYYNTPEVVDGRLFVDLISDTEGLDDVCVEIVAC